MDVEATFRPTKLNGNDSLPGSPALLVGEGLAAVGTGDGGVRSGRSE